MQTGVSLATQYGAPLSLEIPKFVRSSTPEGVDGELADKFSIYPPA